MVKGAGGIIQKKRSRLDHGRFAALERPDTFKQSRAVGAWLGLTPQRAQSGEVDYDGHISRRGDRQLRALLYEAAAVLLTRVRRESALRRWGLMLWKRLGFKRAATALISVCVSEPDSDVIMSNSPQIRENDPGS